MTIKSFHFVFATVFVILHLVSSSGTCNQIANCGQCAYDTNCSWCPSNKHCYTKTSVFIDCPDTPAQIIDAANIYQCCAVSNTCQDCTALLYVECDWCDSNKQCFNATSNNPSLHQCPHSKDIITKNGVCPNTDHRNILKDILSFFKRSYVILISIFIASYIIISVFIYLTIIICEKYKCCQPLTIMLLCIQLLLLLPGMPIYIICILFWKTCIPQSIVTFYTKNKIKSTVMYLLIGTVSTACIITGLHTYYYGPQKIFFVTLIVFAVLSSIVSIHSVQKNNNSCGCCGKLLMFVVKFPLFTLIALLMLCIIAFGIICIFSTIGVYIFNIHKKIKNVHSSYLLQKKEFWILHQFSVSNKYTFLKLNRANKVNILQLFIGFILSIIYFPITCISSIFWGIGQIERDILTFPILSLAVPAISSIIFWVTLGDVLYTKIIPTYISSSINSFDEFGIKDWIIPLIIMAMNAITLIVTALLTFRDKRNSWIYNIFYVIPGVFLIGPFVLLLCPWWVRWFLNIAWFFWDLICVNYTRFQTKNINNAAEVNQPLMDDQNELEEMEIAANAPGAPLNVPFLESKLWKHIRCVCVLLWIPLIVPSVIMYPFTYLFQPLLYFGFAAFIAPFCASFLFWVAFTVYILQYLSINTATFTFISSQTDTTSREINIGLHGLMLVSFAVILISALIPLNKKQISLQQNQLWQLSLDYKYRLRFPLHFVSLWFCSFGVVLGLFFWPFWILKECKYCMRMSKQLWNSDKNDALTNKKIPKPFAFWHIRRYDMSEFNCKHIAMAVSFIPLLVVTPVFIIGWLLTAHTRHIYAFQRRYWFIACILSAMFWCSVVYSLQNMYNFSENSFNFETHFISSDYIIFCVGFIAIVSMVIYTIFLTPKRNNNNGNKCVYFMEFVALLYSLIFFVPFNIFVTYWLCRTALRYCIRCVYAWTLLCTVPCIRSRQNEREEYLINVSIMPTTPIQTVFAKVSFELGYNDDKVKSFAETLQKLWYFRAIDLYDIPDIVWTELDLVHVFKASLFELKDKLKKTETFMKYKESSDISFYSHIKDLLNVFIAINNLESTKKDTQILTQQLSDLCLLNIAKLKRYITGKEWNELKAPKHLKTIIQRKIGLKFRDKPQQIRKEKNGNVQLELEQKCNELPPGQAMADRSVISFDGAAVNEPNYNIGMDKYEPSAPPNHNRENSISVYEAMLPSAPRRCASLNSYDYGSLNEKLLGNEREHSPILLQTDGNGNNEYKYDPMELLDPRDTLQHVATKIAEVLFVENDDKIWNYLSIFPTHCYCRIYHLSLISDSLYHSLMNERQTPIAVRMELLKAINNIRKRSANLPKLTFIEPKQTLGNKSVFKLSNTMTTVEVFDLLEYDLGIPMQSLCEDCNQLMTHFYSNLWDWFFVTKEIWNKLPYFSKYEIVRVRIYDLMQCIKEQSFSANNNNIFLPLLPMDWVNMYNPNLAMKEYLIGNKNFKFKKNMFHLFGVDWSDKTKEQTMKMYQFLDKNMVKKIQVLPNQHRNDENTWTEFMNANVISNHLRFKINYFAVKGQPSSDDVWINKYIQSYFNSK